MTENQKALALLAGLAGGVSGLGAGGGAAMGDMYGDQPYGDPEEARMRGAMYGAVVAPPATLGIAGSGPLAPVAGMMAMTPLMLGADAVIDGPRKRRQRLAEQQAFEQALRDYEMEQRMYGPNLVHGAGQPR